MKISHELKVLRKIVLEQEVFLALKVPHELKVFMYLFILILP